MNKQQRNEYELRFQETFGATAARSFSLGRQALVILLKALDIDSGDRIGVCSFTCLSVAEAIKVCGATPVYLDVDKYLCIDHQEILKHQAGSLKAVILQHTFGLPGQLEKLLSACKEIEATVIEDCAHSLSCSWKGKPLGAFGKGSIYSFQWGKPYSTGQGGMLTVNSEDLLEKVDHKIEKFALPASKKSALLLECKRRLYSILGDQKLAAYLRGIYSQARDIGLIKRSSKMEDKFKFYPGYVRLADSLTTKAGLKQLRNWPKLKQLRRENTEMIEDYFNKAGLPLWPKPKEADVTFLRYPLLTLKKTQIIEKARKRRLDIAGWYSSPVHPLKGGNLVKVDYQNQSCKNAEKIISRLIHIPTGVSLNEKLLKEMLEIIAQNN